jgi:hypothetical protein
MTRMSAPRRAFLRTVGWLPAPSTDPPAFSAYPLWRRVIADLLGVRLPPRSAASARSGANLADAPDGAGAQELSRGRTTVGPQEDSASFRPLSESGSSAADLLQRLAARLAAGLPEAEYAEGSAVLSLRLVTADGSDLELRLVAPGNFLADLAGTAVVLSFWLATDANQNPAGEMSLLGWLDDAGVARFRIPAPGLVSGISVPAQRREGSLAFTRLPSLATHASAAATPESDDRLRRRAVLASPPVTVVAYETSDEKIGIAVEGPVEPDPDTALVVSGRIGHGPRTYWALYLRWSPTARAVSGSVTIGPARTGLEWEIDPKPRRLADLPADILQRSQEAADDASRVRLAEILAGRT